jgi:hypothetical protein
MKVLHPCVSPHICYSNTTNTSVFLYFNGMCFSVTSFSKLLHAPEALRHTHSHTHTHKQHTHERIHTHTPTRAHTHTHTHTHTQTHTHTSTHKLNGLFQTFVELQKKCFTPLNRKMNN